MTGEQRNNDMLLGELIAESKAGKSQRKLLFSETADIKAMIADLTVVVQSSIVADQARLLAVEEDVASHGKAISGLLKVKQRMYIAIASIGGVGGITGALTTNVAKKLGLN